MTINNKIIKKEKKISKEIKGRLDSIIFSPKKIGNLEIKNRLVRSATADANAKMGSPSARYIKTFTDLAKGGVGLIISGIAFVSKKDSIPFELHAFRDKNIPKYKEVVNAVREADNDCKLFAQIGHTGNLYMGKSRLGPSNISWPGDIKPMRALVGEEIKQIVEDFAQSIRRFKEANWDGVEIHGGHAYLISSFLSPYTNKRKDKYGGSVLKRIQIVKEIIDQARELVGNDFPIIIKLNSDDRGGMQPEEFKGGINTQLFIETAKELAKLNVDAIEVSGNYASQKGPLKPENQSYFRGAAEALDINIPIILTGGNRRVDDLNMLLENTKIDFIGMSRPFIREPNLPNKWLSGETSSTKCYSCNTCAEIENLIKGMICHQEKDQKIKTRITRNIMSFAFKKAKAKAEKKQQLKDS